MKHFYSLPFYSTSLYSERNKNSRINVKPLRMCVSKNAAFSECATRTHSAMEETPSSTSLASYVFHPPLSLYLPLPRLLFSYSCSSLARSLSCSFLSFLSSSSISISVSFPFFLPFLFPILPSYSSSPISSSLLFFLIFIALLLPCLSLYSSFLPFLPPPPSYRSSRRHMQMP